MKAEDLKNSILQLAMEGKLVPQDHNDEPASVLLERIREEKEKLIKEKKIRRNYKESFIFRKNGHFYERIGKKGEPVCIDDEISFDVPKNWELCRLSSLGVSTSGKTPKAKELHSQGKYPYFKVGDMNTPGNELYLHITENYLSEEYSSKLFAQNSIVYPKNGGAVFTNKRRILKQESVVDLNTGVFSPYSCLDLMYVYMIFQSIDFKKYHKGTALPTIDKKRIDNILIGLPPFNEQKRIVDKIEEILPLIEEYGINEEQLDKLNSEFPDKLKSSILQEAIRGKLVHQDPNDEPASVLLEKIREEKERLIKEKKIKRNKNESFIYKKNNHYFEKIGKKGEPVCIDDEIPFDIPNSWEWTRIKNISELVTKGTTPKGGKSAYNDTGIKFLRVENIGKNGEINLINIKYIDKEVHENFLKRSILKENDLLISIAGALGRTAIVPDNILPLNANQAISLVRWFNTDLIYVPFIEKSINSPAIQKLLLKQSKVTAIPNLTLEIIRECLVPIPPLNEQIKIVKRIETLLNLIYS